MSPVAKMDPEWAITEIDAFLHVTAQVVPDTGPGVVYFGTVMRGPQTDASARAHVVEQILDRTLPGWRKESPKNDEDYSWLRDQASRAKAALQREAELAEKLGDDAPDMDAANLHPWAWESGASYWNSGHFHQAVMQAAIRINFETQTKLGRMDLSETALFNEAYSLDAPKEGAPDCAWQRTTAARRTRTCTGAPAPSRTGSTPRSETPACTRRRPRTVARSNLRWNSWRRSVCWPGGSSRPTSKRPDSTYRSGFSLRKAGSSQARPARSGASPAVPIAEPPAVSRCSSGMTRQLSRVRNRMGIRNRDRPSCVNPPPVTVKNSGRLMHTHPLTLGHAPLRPLLLLAGHDSPRQPSIDSAHSPAPENRFRIGWFSPRQ